MKIIDADTHVVEPSSVWDLLSSGDEEFRPSILRKQFGATINAHFAGGSTKEFWVIDNFLYGKHNPEFIAQHSNGEFTSSAITLEDVAARLEDMDRQQVDTEVIFSSLFLNIRCTRPPPIWTCPSACISATGARRLSQSRAETGPGSIDSFRIAPTTLPSRCSLTANYLPSFRTSALVFLSQAAPGLPLRYKPRYMCV